MKKLLTVVAITGLLTACGSTKPSGGIDNRAAVLQAQQTQNVNSALDQAPAWMTKVPKSDNAIYAVGTSVSSDFSMADLKAKTLAYAKVCTAAGGMIRSQTKIYQRDTETGSSESSEVAIRSMCADVDISGVETVDVKRVREGTRFRVYVLVALPHGEANLIRKQRANEESTRDTMRRAPEAFKELDNITKTVPQTGAALINSNNAEYVARRDEALKKPGVVVKQYTLN